MIRLARKASQKRVEDLASESGMTGGNWYRIESGDAESVPEETLRAMESALGIILVRKLED
jgi:transcriptional regulator with XRE-family HTH domain